MRAVKTLFFILYLALCFQSCQEKVHNTNSHLSLDDYRSLDTLLYSLNSRKIRAGIDSLSRLDKDSTTADYRTRSFYINHKTFLWIDRKGVDARADSLANYLECIKEMGFSEKKFRLNQIQEDLRRVRNLDFDDANPINRVMARLEYNLTKAYLRYVTGQQFGFMNPTYAFNHLDIHEKDSLHTTYRILFDIKIRHAGKQFFEMAINKIHKDSVSHFLREVEPENKIYHALKKQLTKEKLTSDERARILVNMERCRWRMPDYPSLHKKYVLVNVPSYHLQAVDGQEVLCMRIAFGSFENKTPLMNSSMKRMDINPQWIMPLSIMKKTIIPHLGNHGYFAEKQYFVRDRKTGKNIDWRYVSESMLLSGKYSVIQRGGEGNALGRIVFRFDNNLSIYLHDTSSRDIFEKEARDVSHGCVRVQKPFDLAVFLLSDKSSKMIDKIGYSMNADVSPLGNKKEEMTPHMLAVSDTLDKARLVGSVTIEPQVPIFICYFTMYPNPDGKMETYRDVYGYDKIVYQRLANYI